jgi:hypothetical protein
MNGECDPKLVIVGQSPELTEYRVVLSGDGSNDCLLVNSD